MCSPSLLHFWQVSAGSSRAFRYNSLDNGGNLLRSPESVEPQGSLGHYLPRSLGYHFSSTLFCIGECTQNESFRIAQNEHLGFQESQKSLKMKYYNTKSVLLTFPHPLLFAPPASRPIARLPALPASPVAVISQPPAFPPPTLPPSPVAVISQPPAFPPLRIYYPPPPFSVYTTSPLSMYRPPPLSMYRPSPLPVYSPSPLPVYCPPRHLPAPPHPPPLPLLAPS